MSNKKFSIILMALVAMSCFWAPKTFSQDNTDQTKPPAQIKTPDTKNELVVDEKKPLPSAHEDAPAVGSAPYQSAGSPRRLQQHGLGIGLGQTFLMGNYAKHGDDKITLDLLYSYAASYSFDLLVNAHTSEHKDQNERTRVRGITTSIKGRFVEFDNFSPFLLGGLGFYAPKMKRNINGKNKWSEQKITFGLNFGGGVDLRLNENYVVGILGQMHCPFKVSQDNQPDVKGYYFKLLITGMYLF